MTLGQLGYDGGLTGLSLGVLKSRVRFICSAVS
jgi:hypothetical protein